MNFKRFYVLLVENIFNIKELCILLYAELKYLF